MTLLVGQSHRTHRTEPIEFIGIASVNNDRSDISFQAILEDFTPINNFFVEKRNISSAFHNYIIFKNLTSNVCDPVCNGDLVFVVGNQELETFKSFSSSFLNSPIKLHTERVQIISNSGQFNRLQLQENCFIKIIGLVNEVKLNNILLKIGKSDFSLRGKLSPVNVGDEIEAYGLLLKTPIGTQSQTIQQGEFYVLRISILKNSPLTKKWWQFWK